MAQLEARAYVARLPYYLFDSRQWTGTIKTARTDCELIDTSRPRNIATAIIRVLIRVTLWRSGSGAAGYQRVLRDFPITGSLAPTSGFLPSVSPVTLAIQGTSDDFARTP